MVFSANLKRQDTPLLNISDPFLAETAEYWSTLNYSEDNLNFSFSQIWLNSLIRIDNKPFFYKSWFHVGVKEFLLDESNYIFLSYTAFITKYNIKTNSLEYYKVVSALNISGKNVPTIKISLPWKKPPATCSLPRKFAKRFIRV